MANWITEHPVWVWTDACSLLAVTIWLTSVNGHSIFLFNSSPPLSISFLNTIVSYLGHYFTPTLDQVLNYVPGIHNTPTIEIVYYYLHFLDEEGRLWVSATTFPSHAASGW